MKKFLIIGSIIFALLIAVLLYLLFFSEEGGPGGIFSNLNFGDTTTDFVPAPELPPIDTTVTDEVSLPVLVQITDTPVVGFAEVGSSTAASIIYVEGGTGHVFSYDVNSGQTNRISNITIQHPRRAVVSSEGRYVVIETGRFGTDSLTIITLPLGTSTTPSTFTISEAAANTTILGTTNLVYTVSQNGSTVAKQFDLGAKASLGNLFTIPFSDAVVRWGSDPETAITYPKPAAELYGAVYQVSDGQLERLSLAGYGISAVVSDEFVLAGDIAEGDNFIYEPLLDSLSKSGTFFLPEKCDFNTFAGYEIACAITPDFTDAKAIAAWRKGIRTTTDRLHLIDLFFSQEEVIDFTNYTSATFDIDSLYYANNVSFRNRVDNSLWLLHVDRLNQPTLWYSFA